MDINNLVTMANRIGDFYESMPDAQEAKQDIATHLLKFWEPRMRRALLNHLNQSDTAALHDLVRQAVQEHQALLMPKG